MAADNPTAQPNSSTSGTEAGETRRGYGNSFAKQPLPGKKDRRPDLKGKHQAKPESQDLARQSNKGSKTKPIKKRSARRQKKKRLNRRKAGIIPRKSEKLTKSGLTKTAHRHKPARRKAIHKKGAYRSGRNEQ